MGMHGEGEVAEGLQEVQTVIGLFRACEAGKLVVSRPVEAAGVDDGAPHGGPVAGQELGRRMHDQGRTVVDRPAEVGRRHGVVDDQRDPGVFRDGRDGL